MPPNLTMPKPGERWRHSKSMKVYIIVGLGHSTTTGNAVVVYREDDNLARSSWDAQLWVRELDEFLGWNEDHTRRFAPA